MRRRVIRIGMWMSLAVSVLAGAALALSLIRPSWVGRGGTVLGVSAGQLEFARSSGTLTRQGIAWGMRNAQTSASILMAPHSGWRPTTSSALVTAGSAGAPASAMTLWVLYVPLWPWLTLGSGASGLLWWRAGRKVAAGHCRHCGYDLRGLRGERCPECGKPATGLTAKLLALLGRGVGLRIAWHVGTRPCTPAR